MKTIQQVFDTTIDQGYYDDEELPNSFMCTALIKAFNSGAITYNEMTTAQIEISEYLNPVSASTQINFRTLSVALEYNHLAYDFAARLAIYQDWENKPVLERHPTKSG